MSDLFVNVLKDSTKKKKLPDFQELNLNQRDL